MKCRDFEVCGNEADERFTMDFTDVEPGAFIHWCATCGPVWHGVEKAINAKDAADPKFKEQFADAVNKAGGPLS